MKITKTADRVSFRRLTEKKANIGCNKCPCCGEPYKGIPPIKTWYEKGRHIKIKCYRCRWCGAEWESTPYQYS